MTDQRPTELSFTVPEGMPTPTPLSADIRDAFREYSVSLLDLGVREIDYSSTTPDNGSIGYTVVIKLDGDLADQRAPIEAVLHNVGTHLNRRGSKGTIAVPATTPNPVSGPSRVGLMIIQPFVT